MGGIGILLLAMTVLVIGYFNWLPNLAAPSQIKIEATPEQLARGDYLFNAVLGCPVCHSERNYAAFGGPPVPPLGAGRTCAEPGKPLPGLAESGGMPGTICFRNITPHATGIAGWSDGEILRAIREGIGKDDRALFPIMPAFIYRNLADTDAQAIVAYLHTLTPVNNPLPATDINFPVNWIIRLLPEPLAGPVAQTDPADTLAYGEYLATVARCAFCHSPRDSRTRTPIAGLEFSGGVSFQGKNGLMYSTNLTSDASGLGDITEAQFIALFRRNDDPTATDLNLMPWTYFAGMRDADLAAILSFLKSLPPLAYSEPTLSE